MGNSIPTYYHAAFVTNWVRHPDDAHARTGIQVGVEARSSLPRRLQHQEWWHVGVACWEEHVKHKQACLIGGVLRARDDAAHLQATQHTTMYPHSLMALQVMSVWCEGRKEDWFCTHMGWGPLRTASALASLLHFLVSTCVPPPPTQPYTHIPLL